MPPPLLELRAVGRTYTSGGEPLTVLRDVSLTIQSGEFVAIMGASGSGKSTLMNIIGCLDKPSTGTYAIHGIDVATLSGDALYALSIAKGSAGLYPHEVGVSKSSAGMTSMPLTPRSRK